MLAGLARGALASQTESASFGASRLNEAFDAAADSAGGVIERTFVMAGEKVVLRFAGESMASLLTEAFAHLESPGHPGHSSLRVHLWDRASTGFGTPVPPHEGRIGEEAGRRVLWQNPPLRVVMQPGQGTLSAFDSSGSEAWYWCEDPQALPFWEPSAPFRMVLHWWLGTLGAVLTHAAAVGFEDGGVLIVGRGGSGKSTTSLLALNHGLRFASDDYVAVKPPVALSSPPTVHSLFGTAKLTAEQYENFPQLHAGVTNSDKLDFEKAVVFLGRVAGDRLVRQFPLRAVLVPRVTGLPPTKLRPVSPIVALAGLAPSTIFQLPGTASQDLALMASVVRAVPNFALDLGTDLPAVPVAISELLRTLGAGGA